MEESSTFSKWAWYREKDFNPPSAWEIVSFWRNCPSTWTCSIKEKLMFFCCPPFWIETELCVPEAACEKADIPFFSCNPVVPASVHYLTMLVSTDCNKKLGNAGVDNVTNELLPECLIFVVKLQQGKFCMHQCSLCKWRYANPKPSKNGRSPARSAVHCPAFKKVGHWLFFSTRGQELQVTSKALWLHFKLLRYKRRSSCGGILRGDILRLVHCVLAKIHRMKV